MISRLFVFKAMLCACLCCGVIAAISNFNVVRAETIEEAVSAALQNHPSAEAAMLAVNVSQKERAAEFSGFFPELSTSATWGRVYQDNSTSRGLNVTRGAAYSYFGEGSVSLRQPFFGAYETYNRYNAADARLSSSSFQFSDASENLAFRAVQSYIDVLRARKGLKMLQNHKKKVEGYLKRISSMVDEGAADNAELQQAEEIMIVLKGIVFDYENQLRAAQANYTEVMGYMPEADMHHPEVNYDLIFENSSDAREFAVQYHPSLKSAQMDAQAAQYEIGAETASLIPDLDGELSYLKSDKDDVVGGEAVDARAVLRFNWNFSTGGAQIARIKQRRYEHKETIARVYETQREVERGIRLAYSEYQASQDQLENVNNRLDLSKKLFETYEDQFEGALISQLQLMRADNQYLNTKLEQMNTEHRFLVASYAILTSTGRLQESLAFNTAVLDE